DVETKAFLEYLCKHQPTSKFTDTLERAVYRNRNNQNWRKDYMTLAYDMHMVAKEAAKKAAEKAAKKARKEGISIGRNEGISMGVQQAKLETAKKFLAMGLSVEQVADGTGLSVEEIEKL
ncbi:MAG: hypothetical protein J6B11_09050, partial [Spirochaetales bacterium]|nr:hypothetical protein [Spirochaetales bacterium]